MKTLNQNFTLYKDKKSSAPAVLAVFHFAGGDVFVSDRTIAPGAGAPEFRGLVTSWGEVSAPSGGLFTVKLPEVALELANSGEPPFSSYLDDGGAEGAEAELFLWFEGLGYAEKEPVGRFIISSPIEYADERVRLTLVSAFIKRNRLIGRTIARDDYPGADPDAVGGTENIIYGAPKGVPCHAVSAGAASALVSDITASQTSGIELSLSPDEIAFPGSGTVQAGSEKISYTGISGKALTGVTRGASGTTAVSHRKGAKAFEVKDEYAYLVAGHPVKSIGDVYVGGVRVTSGVTRRINDGGKAKLVFSDKFTLEKSVALSVSEGSHDHQGKLWYGQGTRTTTTRWTAGVNPGWSADEHTGRAFRDSAGYCFFITGNGSNYLDLMSVEGRTPASGTYEGKVLRTEVQNIFQDTVSASFNAPAAGLASALCDGDFNGFCAVMVTSGYVDTKRSFTVPDLGVVVGAKLCSMRGDSTFGGIGKSAITGGIFGGQSCQGGGTSAQAYRTNLQNSGVGAVTWSDFENMSIRSTFVSGASAASCLEQWVEVYYIPHGGGASPAAGVSLSGNSAADVVVGGAVTCDVEGYGDDAAGTFTGTPGALIKNPADVIRHILQEHMDVPAQEIDGSFAAVRAGLSSAIPGGYAFAGVIDKKAGALAVVEGLCAQSRTALRHDGCKARLRLLTGSPGAPLKTLGKGAIKRGSLKITRTGREGVMNRLDVHYLRDFRKSGASPGDYMAAAAASAMYPADGDTGSVALYGPREPVRPFLFGFIGDQAAASDLRDFYITRYKDVKRRCMFTLFLDNFELEEGDVVELDYASPAFSLEGIKFYVEGVAFIPGSLIKGRPDGLAVRAVEV